MEKIETEPEKALERDLASVFGEPDAVEQMVEIRKYYRDVYGIEMPY